MSRELPAAVRRLYEHEAGLMIRAVLFAALVTVPLTLGCGGDEGTSPADGPYNTGITASGGMVAPNTFMVYDGKRYRLVEMLQANLFDETAFHKMGSTKQADIDFVGSLDVFRRDADRAGVYTYTKGQGSGEAAVPATWLRWVRSD